jgi:hypothetical protein
MQDKTFDGELLQDADCQTKGAAGAGVAPLRVSVATLTVAVDPAV